MSTEKKNVPANNVPATVPTLADAAKVTARKPRKASNPEQVALKKSADMLAKWGIELDTSMDGLEIARNNLKENGALNVPVNSDSGLLIRLSDAAMQNIRAAAKGNRNAGIILALIDETEEYTHGTNAQGKPYTSTLAFARDMFPMLEKSTVANFVTGGRKVLLPALRGDMGGVGKQLLAEQSMTNASILAGIIGDPAKRGAALDKLKEYVDAKGKLSTAKARKFVKDFNDDWAKKHGANAEQKDGKNSETDAAMDAAKKQVRENEAEDKARKVKARIAEYIPTAYRTFADGDLTLFVPDGKVAALKAVFQDAMKSGETEKTALLDALYDAFFKGLKIETEQKF